MSSANALIIALISFIVGVLVASFLLVPWPIIYGPFFSGLVLGLIFARKRAVVILAVCLIMLSFGLFRCETAKQNFVSQCLEDGAPNIDPNIEEEQSAETGTPQVVEPSPRISFLEKAREKLQSVINQHFSLPQSGILSAVLLGNQSQISSKWKNKLSAVGIRHIVAVSGMHVIILSAIFFYLAMMIGFSRGKAFYFALIGLWLFIALIGFSASSVRAGIMASALLFCNKIGRQNSSDRALVYAGFIMLSLNPLLLRWDIGFQLSFLASLGIVYLKPVFNFLTKKLGSVGDLLGVTFSAQVFTLPILVYNFNSISLVAPIVNLLVVPLIPFIMTLGLIFLLAGSLLPVLGFLVSLPLWLLISYILFVTNTFSHFSFASISFRLPWLFIPIFYILLAIFVFLIKRRQSAMALP